MRAAVSREEIRKTIFSMNKNKVPGPYGFSDGFFHKAWPIVENGVVEAILEFQSASQASELDYHHFYPQKEEPGFYE